MNLETKITIYKFTPQVFTLTRFPVAGPAVANCEPQGLQLRALQPAIGKRGILHAVATLYKVR